VTVYPASEATVTTTNLIKDLTPEDTWLNPLLHPETVAEELVKQVLKGNHSGCPLNLLAIHPADPGITTCPLSALSTCLTRLRVGMLLFLDLLDGLQGDSGGNLSGYSIC
jgi:hypothetical protein